MERPGYVPVVLRSERFALENVESVPDLSAGGPGCLEREEKHQSLLLLGGVKFKTGRICHHVKDGLLWPYCPELLKRMYFCEVSDTNVFLRRSVLTGQSSSDYFWETADLSQFMPEELPLVWVFFLCYPQTVSEDLLFFLTLLVKKITRRTLDLTKSKCFPQNALADWKPMQVRRKLWQRKLY